MTDTATSPDVTPYEAPSSGSIATVTPPPNGPMNAPA